MKIQVLHKTNKLRDSWSNMLCDSWSVKVVITTSSNDHTQYLVTIDNLNGASTQARFHSRDDNLATSIHPYILHEVTENGCRQSFIQDLLLGGM